MAYVANEMKRYRDTKPESRFTALNHQNKHYAAHMGFFRAFGLKFGNEPGEASGSSTYLPLTILSVRELKEEATDSYDNVGNIIESRSKRIAKILTRQEEGGSLIHLLFLLGKYLEMLLNIQAQKLLNIVHNIGQQKN